MRRAITTLLLLATAVSALAQISAGTCPMNGTGPVRVAKLVAARMLHCHSAKPPSSRRETSECVLTHTCCKVAPVDAQLVLSRWTLVPASTDIGAVPQLLAAAGSERQGDFPFFVEEIGARPPVEKLKTDLRI